MAYDQFDYQLEAARQAMGFPCQYCESHQGHTSSCLLLIGHLVETPGWNPTEADAVMAHGMGIRLD